MPCVFYSKNKNPIFQLQLRAKHTLLNLMFYFPDPLFFGLDHFDSIDNPINGLSPKYKTIDYNLANKESSESLSMDTNNMERVLHNNANFYGCGVTKRSKRFRTGAGSHLGEQGQ